jgi:hypothetical protein
MWVVADLDDEYIAKMEDVLEVYERPYNRQEPVICVDEKPITLHADVRPASPAAPGREARRDNEYERRGTANVFCGVEPKAGRHFTFATPDRTGFEFAQVAVSLAMAYPEAETIHLVMDNLNIHRRKALADVFGADMAAEVWDRFTVHYTPTHGSWLNQAEIEIGIFSRQCLGHRRIPDLKTLRQETKAWNRRVNRDRVKIDWKFNRKAARRKFGYKPKPFKRSETYSEFLIQHPLELIETPQHRCGNRSSQQRGQIRGRRSAGPTATLRGSARLRPQHLRKAEEHLQQPCGTPFV